MTWLPKPVRELLERALVCEFTVLAPSGRPVTHPMLPLWDGERVYMTSSVLFSKKLEHIKRNPRVALSISDPVAAGGLSARCSIQGDATVIEDDPHVTWERIIPLWVAKEPGVEAFLNARYALPLFFERSLIEVTPRRVAWWPDGDVSRPPAIARAREVAA